ncbi:MAG: hypothetical protein R3E87_19835 [Burkholderiaceae bacterium]
MLKRKFLGAIAPKASLSLCAAFSVQAAEVTLATPERRCPPSMRCLEATFSIS